MTKSKAKRITSIEDTGERMVPEHSKGSIVYGEHMARYHSIKQIVKDKTVLDIASGSGYGSALIAEDAKKVIGVDISQEAIDYANKSYKKKNVEFIKGDGTKIPLGNNSVDVVVSFETIEHIEDYKQFMDEIKRVLTTDGVLILSTPNDDEYSEENHFHVHEFRHKELKTLITEYFKHFEVYYQGDWLYSALLPERLTGSEEWREKFETFQYSPIKAEKAIYFLVIASNTPSNQHIAGTGIISEHWSELKKHNNEMVFKTHMDEQAKIIKHLENENKTSKEQLDYLNDELTAARTELARIKESLAWRVTAKSKKLVKRNRNK